MRNVRAYHPALVFLAGFVFIWHAHSQMSVPLAAPLGGILRDMNGYRVTEQRVSADERQVAGMTDYVARVYWRDSVPAFTMYVGYYDRQTEGRTIHSPRNCLPGAGWEILTNGSRTVTVGGSQYILNRYVLKNGVSTAIAYYWYQGRGRVVASEYRVKWNLLRDAALLGHTEEALVRVIVPVADQGAVDLAAKNEASDHADALADSVASRLLVEVARALPGE
jgi:EpsI family protein